MKRDLPDLDDADEEAWLSRLADAAEAEGREPLLGLDEMVLMLDGGSTQATPALPGRDCTSTTPHPS